MIKRVAPWFGVFLLTLVAVYFVVFGVAPLAYPGIVVPMGGMVLAAILLIVGGLRESIRLGSRTVPWNALVGAAYVLLAVVVTFSMLQSTLTDGEMPAWIIAGVAVVNGGALAWFGVQTARDSRHVDLTGEPSNARLVGIALLMVLSITTGAVLWSVAG